MQNCKLCGSPTNFKEGVSKKNGKPWKGYFCQNRDECGNVEWIRENEKKSPTGAYNAPQDGLKLIMEEIQDLREYLESKLEKKSGEYGVQTDRNSTGLPN